MIRTISRQSAYELLNEGLTQEDLDANIQRLNAMTNRQVTDFLHQSAELDDKFVVYSQDDNGLFRDYHCRSGMDGAVLYRKRLDKSGLIIDEMPLLRILDNSLQQRVQVSAEIDVW